MRLFLFTLALVAPAFAPARDTGTRWESFELKNGVRVTVIHAPKAPKQTCFAFLGSGLTLDASGKPQFSHLLEHLLIRSTDPDTLSLPGLELNGETTGGALRLDAYADPAKWRNGFERVARWITARSFTDEVLEREKGRIRSEEEATVASGATQKWAEVAWGQVVRHGATHVDVRGAVAAATALDARAYAEDRVRVGPGLRIVTVGPVKGEEVRPALTELFGTLERSEPADFGGAVEDAAEPGDRRATWDLAARHYLEWYRVPVESASDGGSIYVITQAVGVRAMQNTELGDLGVTVAPGAWSTPEGHFIFFSANLPSGVSHEAVRAALRKVIDDAVAGESGAPSWDLIVRQLRYQTKSPLDFTLTRRQAESRGLGSDLLEAQLVLGMVAQEEMLGVPLEGFHDAFTQLSGERLEELAATALAVTRRGSLMLTPLPASGSPEGGARK